MSARSKDFRLNVATVTIVACRRYEPLGIMRKIPAHESQRRLWLTVIAVVVAGLYQTQRVHRHGMADQAHARRLLVVSIRLRVFGRRRPVPASQRLRK